MAMLRDSPQRAGSAVVLCSLVSSARSTIKTARQTCRTSSEVPQPRAVCSLRPNRTLCSWSWRRRVELLRAARCSAAAVPGGRAARAAAVLARLLRLRIAKFCLSALTAALKAVMRC